MEKPKEVCVPDVCPVCHNIRSVAIKEDRIVCEVCGSFLLFKDMNEAAV